ncbi:uncharacterized protein [Drosophila kikkawai]|uniref:C-type lectin domain-containing protein n=1 Tax=Drosophila kikkawai TaxID=30033 RepID=A0ABM4GA55_DROKI
MHNFGTFFLWALAACTLFDGSFAKSLRFGYTILLDDMSPNQSDSNCLPELRSLLNDAVPARDRGNTSDAVNEIKAKLETLEMKIGDVQVKLPPEIYAKLEGRLQGVEAKLEGQLQEMQSKLEAKLDEILIAVQKKIDNQLQAVVNQLQLVQNKIDAANVEVPASSTITVPSGFELIDWKYYWLGINDQDKEGHFVSVASHKPAPFLKWREGHPSDSNHEQNCVYFDIREMGDYYCNEEFYFICQADNET